MTEACQRGEGRVGQEKHTAPLLKPTYAANVKPVTVAIATFLYILLKGNMFAPTGGNPVLPSDGTQNRFPAISCSHLTDKQFRDLTESLAVREVLRWSVKCKQRSEEHTSELQSR